MEISKKDARQILEHESTSHAPTSPIWATYINALSEACHKESKTFIAALGTALLAKSVDPQVDPFSLKASTGPQGYSARGLCKDVLAAEAPRIGIDLGVRGREPLNNQPFFAEEKISLNLPVKASGREPLRLLVDALTALHAVTTTKEARTALRTFLALRRTKKHKHSIGAEAGDGLTESALLRNICTFVSADSESGRRAQAVAAGLFDIIFGRERVDTGRIFDPSRRFPGDIVVKLGSHLETTNAPQPEIEAEPHYSPASLACEVRDKPISSNDLYHFVQRVIDHNGTRAVVIAVAPQSPLGREATAAFEWAAERGVRLQLYLGWEKIVRDAMFLAMEGETPGTAYRAIYRRLPEVEVSPAGTIHWESLDK